MKAITKNGMRNSGSALVEASVGIVMLTILLVGCVFFLMSTAMTAYYKYGLGFIATQAATYAASRPPATVQDDTVAFAQSMEQQMHIGTGNPTVTVTPTTVGTAVADSVTLADQFSVIGVGQGAWNMHLQATGIAAFISNPTLAANNTTNVTNDITNNTYVTGLQSPLAWFTVVPTSTNNTAPTDMAIGNTGFSAIQAENSNKLAGSFVIPVYDPQQLPTGLQNLPLTSPGYAPQPDSTAVNGGSL